MFAGLQNLAHRCASLVAPTRQCAEISRPYVTAEGGIWPPRLHSAHTLHAISRIRPMLQTSASHTHLSRAQRRRRDTQEATERRHGLPGADSQTREELPRADCRGGLPDAASAAGSGLPGADCQERTARSGLLGARSSVRHAPWSAATGAAAPPAAGRRKITMDQQFGLCSAACAAPTLRLPCAYVAPAPEPARWRDGAMAGWRDGGMARLETSSMFNPSLCMRLITRSASFSAPAAQKPRTSALK